MTAELKGASTPSTYRSVRPWPCLVLPDLDPGVEEVCGLPNPLLETAHPEAVIVWRHGAQDVHSAGVHLKGTETT